MTEVAKNPALLLSEWLEREYHEPDLSLGEVVEPVARKLWDALHEFIGKELGDEWNAATKIHNAMAERVEELESKLAAAEAVHTEIERENNVLRASMANGPGRCPYCELKRKDWARCRSGFPGCSRSDDAMLCPNVGASLEAEERVAKQDEQIKDLLEVQRFLIRVMPEMLDRAQRQKEQSELDAKNLAEMAERRLDEMEKVVKLRDTLGAVERAMRGGNATGSTSDLMDRLSDRCIDTYGENVHSHWVRALRERAEMLRQAIKLTELTTEETK